MDIDPLSRIGLIVGMALALFMGVPQGDYETYTEPIRMDTIRQKLELDVTEPERIEIGKVNRWVCIYGSGFCNTEFADRIVWWASIYGVSPYFVVAVGVFESSLRPDRGSLCTFGIASCRVRFATIDEEVSRAVKTMASYEGNYWQKASIWRTGGTRDTSGYPEKVVRLMESMEL